MKPSIPLKLIAIACLAVVTSGCKVSETAGEHLEQILPVTDTQGKISADRYATVKQIKGNYRRVPADIRRTAKRLSWGLIRTVPDRIEKGQQVPERIYAQVLVDNEHIAVINVVPAGAGRLDVAVRVGLAGDANAQNHFINTLRKVLAGKAAPERDGRFKLPPL